MTAATSLNISFCSSFRCLASFCLHVSLFWWKLIDWGTDLLYSASVVRTTVQQSQLLHNVDLWTKASRPNCPLASLTNDQQHQFSSGCACLSGSIKTTSTSICLLVCAHFKVNAWLPFSFSWHPLIIECCCCCWPKWFISASFRLSDYLVELGVRHAIAESKHLWSLSGKERRGEREKEVEVEGEDRRQSEK